MDPCNCWKSVYYLHRSALQFQFKSGTAVQFPRVFGGISRVQVSCLLQFANLQTLGLPNAHAQTKRTQPNTCAAKVHQVTYLRQPPQQRGAGQRQLRLPSPPGRSGVAAGLRPPAVREIPAGRHRGRRAAGAGLLERRCTWRGFGFSSCFTLAGERIPFAVRLACFECRLAALLCLPLAALPHFIFPRSGPEENHDATSKALPLPQKPAH